MQKYIGILNHTQLFSGVGEMFGEAYAAPESGALLNDVIAEEDSTVIFFVLTGVPCLMSFVKCVMKDFSDLIKMNFYYYKQPGILRFQAA